MKLVKQRIKQRFQGFCWKVHDSAQCFVLHFYTVHVLRNQNVSIGKFLSAK